MTRRCLRHPNAFPRPGPIGAAGKAWMWCPCGMKVPCVESLAAQSRDATVCGIQGELIRQLGRYLECEGIACLLIAQRQPRDQDLASAVRAEISERRREAVWLGHAHLKAEAESRERALARLPRPTVVSGSVPGAAANSLPGAGLPGCGPMSGSEWARTSAPCRSGPQVTPRRPAAVHRLEQLQNVTSHGVAVVMAATANYLIEMAEKLLESTIRRSHNTILHTFNNNRKKIQCWHVWSVLLTNIMCFIAMLSLKKTVMV